MGYKNIPFGELEKFNVLIENPEGTSEKWEYNWANEEFANDFSFAGGFKWPFNYGEILRTLGGDGDRLDAIVYASVPLKRGEVVVCKTIGMMHLIDHIERNGGETDNKIFCVPIQDQLADKLDDILDLTPKQIAEVRDAYMEIARQKKKILNIKGFLGKDKALKEIKNSLK